MVQVKFAPKVDNIEPHKSFHATCTSIHTSTTSTHCKENQQPNDQSLPVAPVRLLLHPAAFLISTSIIIDISINLCSPWEENLLKTSLPPLASSICRFQQFGFQILGSVPLVPSTEIMTMSQQHANNVLKIARRRIIGCLTHQARTRRRLVGSLIQALDNRLAPRLGLVGLGGRLLTRLSK